MRRKQPKHMVIRIIAVLKRAAVILFVLSALSFLVTGLVSGRPTVFGIRPFFVMTDSMEPTIHAKSVILAVPADSGELRVGDIAVYRREAALANSDMPDIYHLSFYVVHRVIRVEDGGQTYIFRGDHEKEEDPPVQAEQILYRVIFP